MVSLVEKIFSIAKTMVYRIETMVREMNTIFTTRETMVKMIQKMVSVAPTMVCVIETSVTGPSISGQSFANPKLVSFWSSSPLASLSIREIHPQISCNSTVFALKISCQAFFYCSGVCVRSSGAPSALNLPPSLNPGLTAGAIQCRPFGPPQNSARRVRQFPPHSVPRAPQRTPPQNLQDFEILRGLRGFEVI
jgi:hypothetical protein